MGTRLPRGPQGPVDERGTFLEASRRFSEAAAKVLEAVADSLRDLGREAQRIRVRWKP